MADDPQTRGDPNPAPGNAPAPAQPQQPPTADPTGPNGGSDDKRFTQAEMEAVLKDRLERQKNALEGQQRKAREEAEAAKLREQAEWQKLAEAHEGKVKELAPQVESLTAEAEGLRAIVEQQIAAETKDWPKEVREFVPAEGALLDRYAAVVRARPLAAKLMAAPPAPGNGPGPRPAGNANTNTVDARKQELLKSGHYTGL